MAQYLITVVKDPTNGGSVKVGSPSSSGIMQEEGTTVNILAIPSSNFSFVNWKINSVVVSTSTSYSFTMPANAIELKATFLESIIPPPTEQEAIYDTSCPKFFFVKSMTDRFFSGDVVDLSEYDATDLLDEPINFDTGKFKLERDETYHGFNYEFAVDSLSYEIGSVGYNYLKSQLFSEGVDVDVKFIYGFGSEEALTIFYIGKVDFNEYKEVEDGELIDFSLRELDFDNLLQTAFEIPQEVELTKDVRLYSKVIPKRIEYKIELPEDVLGVGLGLASKAWFDDAFRTPDAPNPDIERLAKTSDVGYLRFNDGRSGDDDFEDFVTYDFQLDSVDPFPNLKYVFKAKEAGFYDISVKFWVGLFLENEASFTDFSFMTLKLIHVDRDNVTVIQSNSVNSLFNFSPTQFLDPDRVVEFKIDLTYEMGFDDSFYIYIEIDPTDVTFPTLGAITAITAYPYQYDITIPQIEIVGQTQAKQSTAKIETIYDVVNTICKSATEVSTYEILKSDFFDVGGCGSLLYLTNGFNVRGVTDKNLKVAPKNIIESLSKLFCLGWGVEYDINKRELIALEPAEYFYQDSEIFNFDQVSNYSKEIDTSKYYNEIEVGFSKYSKQRETDKGFTLDDVHTKHIYQTPIKTNKNKLSIITDITLSAYEIEILRRKQFEKDGNKVKSNFKEDEEVFGVQLTSATPSETFEYPNENISYEDTTLTIISGTYDFVLEVGEVVDYTSMAGVLQERTVVYFSVTSWEILGTVYYNTFIGFAESLVGTVGGVNDVIITRTTTSSLLLPEGAQPFSTINNILSPATSYNVRYTPKRMLYNWAKLINGGFFGKLGTDQIVFKQGDGNVELVTQFKVGEECLLGDIDRDSIEEGSNVSIANFWGGDYLFLPIKVSFSTSLSFEQLITLKKCLRGNNDTNNYGYVSITNPCGEVEQIFITSVEYSGVEDEAQIEGYLKQL